MACAQSCVLCVSERVGDNELSLTSGCSICLVVSRVVPQVVPQKPRLKLDFIHLLESLHIHLFFACHSQHNKHIRPLRALSTATGCEAKSIDATDIDKPSSLTLRSRQPPLLRSQDAARIIRV